MSSNDLSSETAVPVSVAADAQPATSTIPWRALLMLGATVLLTIALLQIPSEWVTNLGAYGYLGLFIITILSNATIVLPAPALGVAMLAGETMNPWLVGIVSGVGSSIGEITGYMAGLGGSELVARSSIYLRVERWVQRWGTLALFVLAFVPGPLFDLAGIAAGTMRLPFRRFFLACMIGKVLRFILVAWIGYFWGRLF